MKACSAPRGNDGGAAALVAAAASEGQMKPVNLVAKLAAAETELACLKMALAQVKEDREELRQERDDWRREAAKLYAEKLIDAKLRVADESLAQRLEPWRRRKLPRGFGGAGSACSAKAKKDGGHRIPSISSMGLPSASATLIIVLSRGALAFPFSQGRVAKARLPHDRLHAHPSSPSAISESWWRWLRFAAWGPDEAGQPRGPTGGG